MKNEQSADLKMRLSIVEGMTKALESTPFSNIAVKQICTAAHVSRGTFYRYFSNKEEIPFWFIEHFFNRGTFQIGRTLSWYEGHFVTLSGIAKYGAFFRGLEVPDGCPPLRQYATKQHLENLMETLRDYRHVEITPRLEFQVRTFAKTRTDITRMWICDGFPVSPSVFAEYTNSIVPHELYVLMEKQRPLASNASAGTTADSAATPAAPTATANVSPAAAGAAAVSANAPTETE